MSRPPSTSRLPSSRSPCSHTGGPGHSSTPWPRPTPPLPPPRLSGHRASRSTGGQSSAISAAPKLDALLPGPFIGSIAIIARRTRPGRRRGRPGRWRGRVDARAATARPSTTTDNPAGSADSDRRRHRNRQVRGKQRQPCRVRLQPDRPPRRPRKRATTSSPRRNSALSVPLTAAERSATGHRGTARRPGGGLVDTDRDLSGTHHRATVVAGRSACPRKNGLRLRPSKAIQSLITGQKPVRIPRRALAPCRHSIGRPTVEDEPVQPQQAKAPRTQRSAPSLRTLGRHGPRVLGMRASDQQPRYDDHGRPPPAGVRHADNDRDAGPAGDVPRLDAVWSPHADNDPTASRRAATWPASPRAFTPRDTSRGLMQDEGFPAHGHGIGDDFDIDGVG